jgi:conjugative transposon TraM protein
MDNNQSNEDSRKLSNQQKQTMKKYTVFALMAVICAGCMWLIFAPSAADKAKEAETAGFNANIPLPKEEGIIDDKKSAYEQEQIKQKQTERMRSLQDFSALLGNDAKKPADDLLLLDDEPATPKTSGGNASQNRQQSSIQTSARAYQDINRTLGNFYESPKEDPEKEQLRQEMEELKARMEENETRKRTADEQLVLMEKSLQMASKYMPTTQGTVAMPNAEPATVSSNSNTSGKTLAVPVSQVTEQTVSTLPQDMSNAEFIEAYGQVRNLGFYTATDGTGTEIKNTISACIHGYQVVMDGQSVHLRLIESMQAGSKLIPRGTLLSGTAKIQGERLGIHIRSLEYMGTIIPLELSVYDSDGQAGIFIPDLQEMNAAKEILANMGTNAGTSINLSSDAGEQLVADMGRNLIQGVSQFTAKKLREVKVYLKAGYKVFLLSENNLKSNKQLATN